MNNKESIVLADLQTRTIDVPESELPRLYIAVTRRFLTESNTLDMEACITEEVQERILSYLEDIIEDAETEYANMERKSWEDGEYDYILGESNASADYEFIPGDHDPGFRKFNYSKYTDIMFDEMGIDVMDFIHCAIGSNYGYAEAQDNLFYSLGELGESEQEWRRGDGYADEFYSWYDKLFESNQLDFNSRFGHCPDFRQPYSYIYTYMGGESPQWYINRDALEEAIIDSEEEEA